MSLGSIIDSGAVGVWTRPRLADASVTAAVDLHNRLVTLSGVDDRAQVEALFERARALHIRAPGVFAVSVVLGQLSQAVARRPEMEAALLSAWPLRRGQPEAVQQTYAELLIAIGDYARGRQLLDESLATAAPEHKAELLDKALCCGLAEGNLPWLKRLARLEPANDGPMATLRGMISAFDRSGFSHHAGQHQLAVHEKVGGLQLDLRVWRLHDTDDESWAIEVYVALPLRTCLEIGYNIWERQRAYFRERSLPPSLGLDSLATSVVGRPFERLSFPIGHS